jgi:hypothetical protein
MSIFDRTRRTTVWMVGTAAALVAGIGLLSGCSKSNDTPADGSGTTGTAATDGATASPGATDATAGNAGGPGGGGSGGSGGRQATTACGLVTTQDAGGALGGQVTNSVNNAEECHYEAGTSTIAVSFTSAAYDASVAGTLTQLPGVTKIDGIGDAAFAITLEGVTQFHVWAKGKYLVIIVEKSSRDTATAGRALLDKALTRF